MSYKDILVHVDSTMASRGRLRLALALAKRSDATVTGLHVIPEPGVPPYFKPSVVERIAEIYAENAREAADLAEALFHEETQRTTVKTAWECTEGDMDKTIGERARLSDLLVLGQFDTENPPTISAFLLPAKVVFEAAAPILVVPNHGSFGDVGRLPLIAWDGSREAARAVGDAMPLLETAERVSVLAIEPLRHGHTDERAQTTALLTHLSRHAISARRKEMAADSKGVTANLLEHAVAVAADLLIMGAYGHSPIWEFMVGGTTQDLLERTTIPVLMSR
jgi:nucleotide-binding universal stress UspA family protein